MFALQSNIGFVFTAFPCLANSLQKPGFQTVILLWLPGCLGSKTVYSVLYTDELRDVTIILFKQRQHSSTRLTVLIARTDLTIFTYFRAVTVSVSVFFYISYLRLRLLISTYHVTLKLRFVKFCP